MDRSAKRGRTREALRTAALDLFRAKGFEAATVDEIAGAAGVSRTTFFRYFPTKESVVFERPLEMAGVFRQSILERPAEENPLQAFEAALLELADVAKRDERLRSEGLELEKLMQRNPILRHRHGEYVQEQAQVIAATLAERDGSEVREEHRLAAAIGLLVSTSAREKWHASEGEIDAEALLKGLFVKVRELTAT